MINGKARGGCSFYFRISNKIIINANRELNLKVKDVALAFQ